jgi:Ca-activated chloride channel family protein
VIVFGKWRGQPRGKITLTGISGYGPYSEVVRVEKIKATPDNSALRYLWARHRITLLSDYNKLRPNDKRIKEVTDLGLTYSLLTAYTSFVAVDSQARYQNGQATTVNQPLPLPQGVSDYAVGGMKLSRAYAPTMAMRPAPAESEDKTIREKIRQKDEGKRRVVLEDVTVGEGLSKEVVLNFLQKKIKDLEKSWIAGEPGGKLVLKCTLDKDGKVKNVSILTSSLKNSRFQNSFIEEMKKWQFPTIPNAKERQVTFSLAFGS